MNHQVTIYTTPTCSWYQAAKDYLSSRGIAFEEVDVSADMNRARELLEKTGQYGVPAVRRTGPRYRRRDGGRIRPPANRRAIRTLMVPR